MWQYSWTGTVPGISGQVDRDRFVGTLSDLQAFAASGGNALAQVNGNDALSAVNWASDGHVELYMGSAAGGAQHVYTTGGTDTWTQVYDYPGAASCGVASAMSPSSPSGARAELFDPTATGTQELYFGAMGWTPWADFGGPSMTRLSTAVGLDGHVEVYGLAPDGSLQVNAADPSTGAWGGWQSLGGQLVTGAAPIVWNDGHIELFATDATGAAWHVWTTGGKWGSPQSLGGNLASRPVPVRWPDGHVEVYARGQDGHTYASAWNQAWSPFAAIESQTDILGEVSAVMNPSGSAELFARNAGGQVVHMWWGASGWNTWQLLGSETVASDPLGWVRSDGSGVVFAVTAAGDLVKSARASNGAWGAWGTIASAVSTCVAVPPVGGGQEAGVEGGTGADGGAASNEDAGARVGDAARPAPPAEDAASGGCAVGRGASTSRWGAGLMLLAALGSRRRRRLRGPG